MTYRTFERVLVCVALLAVLAAAVLFIFLVLTRPADARESLFPAPPREVRVSAVVSVSLKPAPTPSPPTPKPDAVWERLAHCESRKRWHLDAEFDGGLQFHPDTWRRAGGTKYAAFAHQASKAQQISIAKAWLAKTDWKQWPRCSRKLGLR